MLQPSKYEDKLRQESNETLVSNSFVLLNCKVKILKNLYEHFLRIMNLARSCLFGVESFCLAELVLNCCSASQMLSDKSTPDYNKMHMKK